MTIELKKFGGVLTSRGAGREAWFALQPILRNINSREKIEISFDGFLTLSLGWADEFLTPLKDQFKDRVVLLPSTNPSVQITLEILDEGKQRRE